MLERMIRGRGDPDRPGDGRLGPEPHHRQLPLRARRLDGDAGRLDGEEVPRRVHRGDRARRARHGAPRARSRAARGIRSAVAAMTRPIRNAVTLVIDGREVTAPEGTMLVDAAKKGDVEIPVFCYEPKLGEPVGACRMCLVEIEGMPKLQTACSTPVRDGMVVYTQTDRVKEAQNAVVEFLLVNHPLDCPVCDKGGECPLQDIAMGWGPGKSRFTDPKRHFQKPLDALAAGGDRPRALHPLLPLRPLQPGGGRGRAAPAAGARRQDLRRHLRRAALHRALPRQHHRALPGRGADHLHLPLPRAALGHRGRRLGLHALPEPVQRQVHGPRRARAARAGPRQRRGRRRLALRQGPLRLPDVQLGGADHPADGPRRRRQPQPDRLGRRVAAGRRRPPDAAGESAAAILVGGGTSNEEGWLVQRILREALGSPNIDCSRARSTPRLLRRALAPRADGPRSRTSTTPTRSSSLGADPLHEMPILDLRIRKAVRRAGAKLAGRLRAPDRARRRRAETRSATRPATARPSSARWPARSGPRATTRAAHSRRRPPRSPRRCAAPDQTIVWGERLWREPRRRRGAARLRRGPRACTERIGAGPARGPRGVERPRPARGRLPAGRRPGPRPAPAGRDAPQIRDGLAADELGPCCSSTPTRSATHPDAEGWRKALGRLVRRRDRDRSRTSPPRSPTSSSRPRPTRRRRAPSPTPTAASSGCAATSRCPERCAPAGRCSPSSPPRSAASSTSTAPAGVFDALASGRRPSTTASPTRRSAARASAGKSATPASGRRVDGARRRDPTGAVPTGDASATATRVDLPPTAPATGLVLGTYRDLWADRGHRAQSGAPLPDARSRGSSWPPRTPRRWSSSNGDEVTVSVNGVERRGQGRDPRADAAGRGVPDRGHAGGERQRARPTGVSPQSRSQVSAAVILPIADVDFAESTWRDGRQVDRDLRGHLRDRADADRRSSAS